MTGNSGPPMTDEPGLHHPTAAMSPILRTQLASACQHLFESSNVSNDRQQSFLRTVEQILETSKLEALAEFAAGAGHEINNPVATIVGRVQLLLNEERDPHRAMALQIIGGQALRIRDMIGDVMLFSRPPHPRPEFVNLLEVATKAWESQAELVRLRKAALHSEIPADLMLWADRPQTLVLLSSLVRNSLESGDHPGFEITLSASVQVRNDHHWAVICVDDNGPGITDTVREHLFDPFYSGRQAGRGLGFGLTKCWRIVQMHGGSIGVSDRNDGQTRFEIWLPLPSQ
jgi:signal transduction histidine kinase